MADQSFLKKMRVFCHNQKGSFLGTLILGCCLNSISSPLSYANEGATVSAEPGAEEGAKPKKRDLTKSYSTEPLESCDRPSRPLVQELACGTPQYKDYARRVQIYNNCIKAVDTAILLNMPHCAKIDGLQATTIAKTRSPASLSASSGDKIEKNQSERDQILLDVPALVEPQHKEASRAAKK